jgi:UDP-glucose 4-epimerase
MKVLVTGAGGFIGSHIFLLFQEYGYTVCGWDLRAGQIGNTCIDAVDMLDSDSVKRKLEEESTDIIIHCAGNADVGKSVQNPLDDFKGNVEITHNLLFGLHELGMNAARVVFISSAGVYGNPKHLPIREDEPLNPLSPYALHKKMCEDICQYMSINYGMDIKIIRIFSAYGKGLRKQIFWDMYQKAKKTGKLEMFGNGNESRDYINIVDVMNAIYLVATKAPKEEIIYNIANGEEVAIRRATEIFARQYGIKNEYILFNGHVREGDPLNWKADISKLKFLGYQPSVSIEEGIENYIVWLKSEANDK